MTATPRRIPSRILALIFAAAVLLAAASAARAQPTFTTPAKLTGPTGGEPSIATDGKGNVYVDGPQGIESGVLGASGSGGVGFWSSHDDGSTFGPGKLIGSFVGGGDDDVVVTPDAKVYVDDLEATATEVCVSTDHGTTFDSIGPTADPDHCSHVGIGQTAPSDDRPWLTTDRAGRLYLTYHEFVSAQPLIFRSDNGGMDLFGAGPCGSIITDPTIESNVPTDITGGTLVAKPVTDAAGNLYVLFATTTQQENAAAAASGQPSGAFSQLYMAVSTDHCQNFKDYTIYDGASKGMNVNQFGDVFNALTVDGAGNLYTVAAGYVNASQPFPPVANLYMFSSADHGQTWSGPTQIGSTNSSHMMPSATGGPRAGQLAVGYFQTINGKTDPNDSTDKWTYTTAETRNAAATQPTFTYADVNPGFDYHNGDICNQGILCTGTGGDRSLADFTSATVDAAGCPLFTFAGNPGGSPTTNNDPGVTVDFVARQLTDCFPAATATTASGTGAAATIAGAATLVTALSKAHGSPTRGRAGTGGCIAARRLTFRINPVPNGRVVKAGAFVNGHKVAARRGHNLVGISFRRPAGGKLHVKIITTNNRGGRVITTRDFTGCTRTKVRGKTHRHKVKHGTKRTRR